MPVLEAAVEVAGIFLCARRGAARICNRGQQLERRWRVAVEEVQLEVGDRIEIGGQSEVVRAMEPQASAFSGGVLVD